MKNSFYIDLQRFMLTPTKFPLSRHLDFLYFNFLGEQMVLGFLGNNSRLF